MRPANWLLQLSVAGVVAGTLGGCVIREASYRDHGGYEDRPVERPNVVYAEPPPPPAQPVYIEQAPPQQEMTMVVRQAPPPPIAERRPAPPGPGWVWVDGYWVVHRGHWEWVKGAWNRAPRVNAHWQPNHWEQQGGQWHLIVGGWR